jgi:large repetitive protein
MKRILLLLIVLLSNLGIIYSQTHFSKVWSGNGLDHMNFYVTSATINGINLQNGDEIAVYDAGYCVGVGVYTGSYDVRVKASKDDPSTTTVIDGYREGNSFTFRLWDASESNEVTDVSVSVLSGNTTFVAGGTAYVSLAGSVACTPPTAPTVSLTQPSCGSSTGTITVTAPTGSGITYSIDGSDYSNTTGTFTGVSSGIYSVTAKSPLGCISIVTSVTINAQPVIPTQPGTITGNTPVCQGTSQTYSVTAVSGATSYTWTLPSGWTGTSTTNSITATVGATSGNITVTANNTCGSSSASTLSVNFTTAPAQPGTITGSTAICQGTSQTYSVTAVSGATSYTWSLPSGWNGTSTTNSITATVGATSGNITVTANNSCGSSTAQTLAVTVSALPAQPGTISGSATPCQGSSQTYSVTAVSGATSYTWTLPSGWNGTSTSNSITATVGATSDNISVTANNTCGSGTARTLAVTVAVIPSQPGTITGSATPCQGSSQTYSVTAVSGATSYTWTLPSGWTGTSTTNSITATVGATSGNITVTANNTCGSSSASTLSVNFTTTPAQPGTITGSTAICQGTSQTYSVTTVSGATSYTWTLPSGWNGTSTTNSITATVGATSGNITVTANNTCGSGTAQTLAVTVSALPAQPGTITGSATPCLGSSQTYSVTAVSGATSYTWTLPSGWNGTSTTNSITATVGATSDNISVTANNTCGSGTARTLAVTVAVIPSQPGTITGSATPCQGSSQTYSVTAVSGATSYTWTLPSGWTGTSTTNSITATVGATSGNITVTANNTCGSSSASTLSVNFTTAPAQPGTITGSTAICQGTSQTYSVIAVSGATSYTWTLPSGWNGTSTTNSITATVGATSGNITVTANNTCGSGTAQTLAVTVSPLPAQPGTISGSATPCQGSSQTYSVTAVSGATSYTWTLPSGWTGTSTTNSITATVGATSGNITVTANNTCGSGTARTLAVTVATAPAQPGTIAGSASPCQGSSQIYSVTAVSGATSYTWTLPSGWSGTSTTNSITATVGATSGNVSVTANNTCGSGTARTLAVTVANAPAQPGAITGSTTPCQGSSQIYSVTAVSGATSYTWTMPSGWTGTSTTNAITSTIGATSGSISVKANNTCGSGTAQTLAVTVSALPAQPGTITGSTTPCQGSSQTYSVTAVSGATSYTWTLPSGWTGTSTTNSITATVGATNGNISVTANNTCGSGTARTQAVTVATAPAQPGTITGSATPCQGSSQIYSVTAVSGATSYTWTLPSGWTGTSTTNSITANVGATSGNISVMANNSCGSGTSRTLSVTVSTTVAQPGSITGSTTVCQGSSQTYSISSVSGATSYTWSLPSGWSGSSTTTSITATAGASGGDISVTANNSCGTSIARTLSITVTTSPAQPGTISGNTTVCQGSSQTYIISSVSGASSYTWTLPSGWTGSSTSTSISATAGATSGNISVTANNSCGSGTSRTLSITVSTTPAQPGSITGSTTVCQGSSQTYSISSVTGATSYTWSLPSGWSGSSTSTSITATIGASGGDISVTASNSCSTSTARTLSITAIATPEAPTLGAITQPTCAVATGGVVLSGLPSTGTWTLTRTPGGTTATGTGSSATISELSTGTYTYTVSVESGCTSGASDDVVINAQPPTPSAPTISQDGNVLHSDAPDGNQWYNLNGSIDGATSQDYSPTSNGDYYAIVSLEGCNSDPSDTINFILSGINQEMLSASINLYPNPVSNELIIEIKGITKITNFEILNSEGQVVFKGNVIEKTVIETNHFTPGIYLIKLEIGNNYVCKKIVKK